MYQCNDKYKTKGKVNCRTPHLRENEIKDLFVSALNKITDDKDEVINNLETLIDLKADTTPLEQEKASLLEEMNRLARLANTEILTNSRKTIPQQEYDNKYNQYVQEYEEKKARYEALDEEIKNRLIQVENCRTFIDEFRKLDGAVTEFSEKLWNTLLQEMVVNKNKTVTVIFRSGIKVELEK